MNRVEDWVHRTSDSQPRGPETSGKRAMPPPKNRLSILSVKLKCVPQRLLNELGFPLAGIQHFGPSPSSRKSSSMGGLMRGLGVRRECAQHCESSTSLAFVSHNCGDWSLRGRQEWCTAEESGDVGTYPIDNSDRAWLEANIEIFEEVTKRSNSATNEDEDEDEEDDDRIRGNY